MPSPIRQLLSQTSYDADGTTTVWDFSFASGYLDKTHVKAFYLDVTGTRVDITVTLDMFIGDFQLNITPALAVGNELTIYRDTPKDAPLVNFADKASFTEVALDLMATQAVFVAAEASDGLATAITSVAEIAAQVTLAADFAAKAELEAIAAAASANGAAAQAANATASAASALASKLAAAASEAGVAASAAAALASANAADDSEAASLAYSVASAASASSATASATAAASSATAAATSAGAAATSATASAASATASANSATTSGNSATASATSSTNSANSATASAASATASAASASAAATSASNAATSEANAASIAAGNISASTVGAPAKATPVDADLLAVMDSASSFALVKTTWAQIKATLKTYFDTLYRPTVSYLTPIVPGAVNSVTQGSLASNARRVSFGLVDVSSNAADLLYVRLGTASGIVSGTGYIGGIFNLAGSLGTANGFNSLAIISIRQDASSVFRGDLSVELLDAATFTYIIRSSIAAQNSADVAISNTVVVLPDLLTQVQIFWGGSTQFDSGIIYPRVEY